MRKINYSRKSNRRGNDYDSFTMTILAITAVWLMIVIAVVAGA
mgnify:CR=1 FL=1